jgi:hypothetical protein
MSLAIFFRKYSNWAAFDKKSLANIFLKPQNQIISNLVGFIILKSNILRMIQLNIGSNWPNGFQRRFFRKENNK